MWRPDCSQSAQRNSSICVCQWYFRPETIIFHRKHRNSMLVAGCTETFAIAPCAPPSSNTTLSLGATNRAPYITFAHDTLNPNNKTTPPAKW